jgi:hypothetical protein
VEKDRRSTITLNFKVCTSTIGPENVSNVIQLMKEGVVEEMLKE